jgi:hypothetical protein
MISISRGIHTMVASSQAYGVLVQQRAVVICKSTRMRDDGRQGSRTWIDGFPATADCAPHALPASDDQRRIIYDIAPTVPVC